MAGSLLLVGARAQADERPAASAVAEALFESGRQLIEQGRYAEACPQLAESQRVDPRLGVLMYLARCHELTGKTASAWAEYTEARSQAERLGRDDRRALADEHARALEAKLSRVIIRAESPADGLRVSLDGEQIGVSALGTALPVNPGRHTLTVSAPGRDSFTTTFDANPGPSTREVQVSELVSSRAPSPPPPEVRPRSHRAQQAIAGTLGALGVGGAGLGTYLGVEAFVKNSDAGRQCPTNRSCTLLGIDLDHSARADATGSNIAFAAASACAVAALVVVLLPRSASTSARLSPRGLELGGAW